MNIGYSDVQLIDLPDEILLLIFKNLANIEVLYSLLDVNKRLHNLASDRFFTEYLTLLVYSPNGIRSTIINSMLERFYRQILPNIHSKIKWLDLESSSMKDILSATEYPNLHGLTLFHVERETDLCPFGVQRSHEWYYCTIERLKFRQQSPTFTSSTLTELLEVLYYDDTLVPLLHRMSHLDVLFLNVCIEHNIPHEPFIDGNNLKNNIINYMPRLNKFVFSIHSNIDHLLHLPSNDDIQHTFKDLQNYQVVSYIHYFPKSNISQCHIYSYPYYMDSLYRLTNSFPDGLFEFVSKIYLFDEKPFEHVFFMRIAQAFPYLKTLLIDNNSPQKYKHDSESNESDENLKIIKYSHLNLLIINCSHEDYLEQFLDYNKTCLSNHIKLVVDYRSLQTVTHNFTRTLTRINCEKIRFIYDIDKYNVPKSFYNYFSHIETL
ncbi:hypothetical protein I4U23_017261 [Adineta vaga]|nr:hypothetical protein I4U23_017261 [Adineta vaga]